MMTRNQIIQLLGSELKKNSFVFALWLEGADAHNRVDKYSDIDLWIDVKDGKENQVFKEIELILSKLGKIDFAHEIIHPHPKIRQKFFHLTKTSKFLIIDVCIQKHSRVFDYTTGFKDEKVKILFDKKNVITFKQLDKAEFTKLKIERIKQLKKSFSFFQIWVEKEMGRKHFLEALNYYHEKILKPLIELLRLKYEPTKKDFYLKDIYSDLPKKYLTKLESLYKINSIIDLKTKVKKANEFFFDI